MRCEEPCGKVIYTTETTAQLMCIKAALEGDPSLVWYKDKTCGNDVWHVTNGRKRGQTTGKRMRWMESFNGSHEVSGGAGTSDEHLACA